MPDEEEFDGVLLISRRCTAGHRFPSLCAEFFKRPRILGLHGSRPDDYLRICHCVNFLAPHITEVRQNCARWALP